jgi:hypothetical protein
MVPDVRQLIVKVNDNTLTVPTPTGEERDWLYNLSHEPREIDSSILCSSVVRAWLKSYWGRSNQVEIWLHEHQVILRDFAKREFFHFYTEKLGGYDEERQGYFPEYHVAANFRQMFSSFLPHFSAVQLHSSGVIRNNQVALFLAPDGGGKTTVLRHSTGDLVLSDDQIILRRQGEAFVAYATPFGTITSGPCQAKLGAIFVLQSAPIFELSSLSVPELIRSVWIEHQSYSLFLPKDLKKRAFNLLYDACHQVPCYRMRFPKDYVDWDAIDKAMAK